MFIKNKYTNWYFNIINHAKIKDFGEEYTELHHIIPRCLFGKWVSGNPDDQSNLVRLTAREHFICHLLLVKMVDTDDKWRKLTHALLSMMRKSKNQNRHILTSWEYHYVRKQFSKSRKGIARPQTIEEREKRSKTLMGHKHSEETKKKIGDKNRGLIRDAKVRENISIASQKRPTQSLYTRQKRSKTLMGHKLSEETKKKIRDKNIGRKHSSDSNKLKGLHAKNKIWVHNSEARIRISATDVDYHLSQGWILGKGKINRLVK